MRLHHLEITGFGPFADTVRIDFDALSDAGLFLLSGPTGAGKSSVLDAVCFALYGDVPGDRSTAKRLRSDQAGDDVVPRVVLEATMTGRRFRIDRSPAWQNCGRLSPRRLVTRWPVSSRRVDSGCHGVASSSLARRSEITTRACSVVNPEPRFLGRCQAGERSMRNRRPVIVASRTTRGPTSSPAWSLRSRLAVDRSPGTSP